MITLVKTSKGGFNMESVVSWHTLGDLTRVILIHSDAEVNGYIDFDGHEAKRVSEILANIALFDATSPMQKG